MTRTQNPDEFAEITLRDLEHLIQQFADDSLEVRFHRTELQRARKPASHYAGFGGLKMKQGEFRLEVVANLSNASESEQCFFGEWNSGQAGSLIPHDDMYAFVGEDIDGRRWSTQRLVLGGRFDLLEQRHHAVLTTTCHRIAVSKGVLDSDRSVLVCVDGASDIPFRQVSRTEVHRPSGEHSLSNEWDSDSVSTTAGTLYFRRDGTRIRVLCELATGVDPEHFANSVAQALCFLTGRPQNWSVLAVQSGWAFEATFRKVMPAEGGNASCSLQALELSSEYWKICGLFIDRCLADSDSEKWPAFSRVFWNATEMASVSITARGLGFAVAVEALASLAQIPETALKIDEIARVRSHLKQWDGDSDVKSHAMSLLSMLSKPPIKRKLRNLVVLGVLEERHFESWDNLRHRFAHGNWNNKFDQKFYSELDTMRDATKCLILQELGYVGRRQDRSLPGWPINSYPYPRA